MSKKAWLLTWTTYGTWLPGDERGFVSSVRTAHGDKAVHNQPDTPYDADHPNLMRHAQKLMVSEPVRLNRHHAEAVMAEFHRTAAHHRWQLLAAAVMHNHVHLVVITPEDIAGNRLLQEFKSYGSRVLNKSFGTPRAGTWWTRSGSTRALSDDAALAGAVSYTRQQQHSLLIWSVE
jgi:REP element-mobilizing transposase RayT